MRKLIVNLLYDVASQLCELADALSPTADEIWRERRWKQWSELGDIAMVHDGPPITDRDEPRNFPYYGNDVDHGQD